MVLLEDCEYRPVGCLEPVVGMAAVKGSGVAVVAVYAEKSSVVGRIVESALLY